MKTYTQLFYNKFCEYPQEALLTKEVQALIEKAARIIEEKEGIDEAKHFKNLMNCASAI
jgi:hypothetical protein